MAVNHDAPQSKASAPAPAAGRGVRAGRWVALVARHSWRRTREHNAMAISASLSYRTIFALVPALVLAFFVLKAAGVVEDGKRTLRGVLEAAGLAQISIRAEEFPLASQPAASQPADSQPAESPVFNLAEQIEKAVDGVEKKMTFARLGPVGLVLLAWSAITLLTTMERALNRIFEAPRSRPLALRVFLYWSAITFLPIVGLAFGYLATKAAQFVAGHAALAGLVVALDLVASLALGAAVLACIYRFLPNAHVPFRFALVGAGVVMPLWIAARWGFALYVSQFVAKGSVYGALGLLPLFLVWINLCWYGFLLGAEVTFVAGRWRRLAAAEGPARLGAGGEEALRAALVVGGAFVARRGPVPLAEIAEALGAPEPDVRRLLERLVQAGIVTAVVPEEAATGASASGAARCGSDAAGAAASSAASSGAAAEAYLPSRPLEAVAARDVLALTTPGEEDRLDPQVASALREVRRRIRHALAETSLGELLQPAARPGAPPAGA